MKKFLRMTALVVGTVMVAAAIVALSLDDPKPGYHLNNLANFEGISLSKISSTNAKKGRFKTSVVFTRQPGQVQRKEFYGQEISINGNEKIDHIFIGITNNHLARIEVWNHGRLIEVSELGFMGKMTWGDEQLLSTEFFDQTNSKYSGTSKVRMQFNNGSSFLGNIAELGVDLSHYGDLSGDKVISLYAKGIDTQVYAQPIFKDFKIWKNYSSPD